ncbi:MAG: hypothetical protein SGI84_07345 [Gemmatimonadota bacterium]|nr:hypothetical protein [Gemmatimonadota bacterium]
MDSSPTSPSPPGPAPAAGRHLGDLTRTGTTWQVHVETRPQGQLTAGRVHFVSPQASRATGWIFLEWTEQDVLHRFNEFSPIELWKLLESLE